MFTSHSSPSSRSLLRTPLKKRSVAKFPGATHDPSKACLEDDKLNQLCKRRGTLRPPLDRINLILADPSAASRSRLGDFLALTSTTRLCEKEESFLQLLLGYYATSVEEEETASMPGPFGPRWIQPGRIRLPPTQILKQDLNAPFKNARVRTLLTNPLRPTSPSPHE